MRGFPKAFGPRPDTRVDVVVPAHNEEERIAPVLAAIRKAPSLGQLIVVSDASADGTEPRSYRLADKVVVSQARNKGSALAAGLEHVRSPVVAFIDGDLSGLTPSHVEALLTAPPYTGQLVALRPSTPRLLRRLPPISGERRLPTDVARRARLAGAGWRSEAKLNAKVAELGLPVRHLVFAGVRNPGKTARHPSELLHVGAAYLAHLPYMAAYSLSVPREMEVVR